jgi:HAD superfamily hydrolase (TIGR01490 family)
VSAWREVKEVQEVKEVEEKSGGVGAFFDLDGTLVALPSLERRFFGRLRYRGAIPVRNYFFWLWEAGRLAPRGIGGILRENKMYLRGLTADQAESSELSSGHVLFGAGINRVAWHATQGHAIVLVSGTLEPLAEEVARTLEVELATRGLFVAIRVCATRLEEVKRRWTGRIVGDAMNGDAKTRAVKAAALEMKLDLAICYAYGDSADDQRMLESVGRPVAVNSREELARLARMRGWPVLHWKSKEHLTKRHGEHRGSCCKAEAITPMHGEEKERANAGSTR